MNITRFVWLALGIWGLLYGFAAVTNVQIIWMSPITGIAALITGVLALAIAFKGG